MNPAQGIELHCQGGPGASFSGWTVRQVSQLKVRTQSSSQSIKPSLLPWLHPRALCHAIFIPSSPISGISSTTYIFSWGTTPRINLIIFMSTTTTLPMNLKDLSEWQPKTSPMRQQRLLRSKSVCTLPSRSHRGGDALTSYAPGFYRVRW